MRFHYGSGACSFCVDVSLVLTVVRTHGITTEYVPESRAALGEIYASMSNDESQRERGGGRGRESV